MHRCYCRGMDMGMGAAQGTCGHGHTTMVHGALCTSVAHMVHGILARTWYMHGTWYCNMDIIAAWYGHGTGALQHGTAQRTHTFLCGTNQVQRAVNPPRHIVYDLGHVLIIYPRNLVLGMSLGMRCRRAAVRGNWPKYIIGLHI